MMPSSSKKATKRIIRLALLISITVIGRLLMQPIPNVQPVTVIIMLVTIYYGLFDGVTVAIGSILLSNIFMGMGPWTIGQILSYYLVALLTSLLMKYPYQKKWRYQTMVGACIAVLMGFVYGFVISVWSVFLFKMNHFWVYYLNGLSFDALHAMGNGLFYLILEPVLLKIFRKDETHQLD